MRYLLSFPTKPKAEKWAKSFDYGRACNGQPPLVVDLYGLEYAVYNPAPEIHAGPFRIPGTEPTPYTPAQDPLFGTWAREALQKIRDVPTPTQDPLF